MTRDNIYVSLIAPADPGKSPNTCVGKITVEIRMFFPPWTDPDELTDRFNQAVDEALEKLMERRE